MAEKLLAAKQLKIWVLQPTIAQDLIGEILHVLQDGEPGHQPRGERRLPRPVGINRAEALLEKAPVDCAGELRQRMVHVHDPIEPRLEQVALPTIPPLSRSHRITLRCIAAGKRITSKPADQFAREPIHNAKKPTNAIAWPHRKPMPVQRLVKTSRATIEY